MVAANAKQINVREREGEKTICEEQPRGVCAFILTGKYYFVFRNFRKEERRFRLMSNTRNRKICQTGEFQAPLRAEGPSHQSRAGDVKPSGSQSSGGFFLAFFYDRLWVMWRFLWCWTPGLLVACGLGLDGFHLPWGRCARACNAGLMRDD